jgi:type II secretory pathway pseudopilin PulG
MVAPRSTRGEAGFSLIEILIAFLVGIFLLAMVFPAIQRFTHRENMEAIARETASLLRLARREAIKENATTDVIFDFNAGQVYAFVDGNGTNVEEAGERELGRFTLPKATSFRAAEDAAAQGANALITFDDGNSCTTPPPASAAVSCAAYGISGIAAFRPDGSAVRTGAVRFGDGYQNVLEVSIATAATGKIEMRKWDPASSSYLLRDQNGTPWKWYP